MRIDPRDWPAERVVDGISRRLRDACGPWRFAGAAARALLAPLHHTVWEVTGSTAAHHRRTVAHTLSPFPDAVPAMWLAAVHALRAPGLVDAPERAELQQLPSAQAEELLLAEGDLVLLTIWRRLVAVHDLKENGSPALNAAGNAFQLPRRHDEWKGLWRAVRTWRGLEGWVDCPEADAPWRTQPQPAQARPAQRRPVPLSGRDHA